MVLTEKTLIIAVKSNCDGCRALVESSLNELAIVEVIVVSADDIGYDEWIIQQPIFIAPDVLTAFDIRWPPFYVVVDPLSASVVVEGVVFGPEQIAAEIAPFLNP